ncbi:MAG: hypothetical protein JNL21_18695, partial [Myxococcales bacterium]|nr:hypothetical protein [Myxococcales bacterium]
MSSGRGLVIAALGAGALGCSTVVVNPDGSGGNEGDTAVPTASTGGGAGGSPSCPGQLFLGDPDGSNYVAVDDTHAYWASRQGGIYRADLATGDVTLLAQYGLALGAIAVDRDYVYGAYQTVIFRIPKEGGAEEVLASKDHTDRFVDIRVADDTLIAVDRWGEVFELDLV